MKLICSRLVSALLLAAVLPRLTASAKDPVDYVRPMIGTDATGHTFPGAIVPFGMVQLSPDTGFHDWKHSAGYDYPDKTLAGFSHTHLSGVGCQDAGDFLFLPYAGQAPARAAFSHDHEHAEAGYYQVELTDSKINVELTATAHAGFHRYTFPAAGPAHVLIDLASNIGIPKNGIAAVGFQRRGRPHGLGLPALHSVGAGTVDFLRRGIFPTHHRARFDLRRFQRVGQDDPRAPGFRACR